MQYLKCNNCNNHKTAHSLSSSNYSWIIPLQPSSRQSTVGGGLRKLKPWIPLIKHSQKCKLYFPPKARMTSFRLHTTYNSGNPQLRICKCFHRCGAYLFTLFKVETTLEYRTYKNGGPLWVNLVAFGLKRVWNSIGGQIFYCNISLFFLLLVHFERGPPLKHTSTIVCVCQWVAIWASNKF